MGGTAVWVARQCYLVPTLRSDCLLRWTLVCSYRKLKSVRQEGVVSQPVMNLRLLSGIVLVPLPLSAVPFGPSLSASLSAGRLLPGGCRVKLASL